MIKISLVHSVAFVWIGKFVAPSENWRHIARKLYEYELMIVDSGTLYIANENKEYEVHEGEYVLMRPCEQQHGYHASKCSFHWIHFIYNEEFNDLEGDYIMISEQGKLSDFTRLTRLISDIYFVWHNYSDRHYASYLVTTLLMEIMNQNALCGQSKRKEGKEGNAHGSVCRKIEAYLKWNCYITTKMCDIAEYLGYSEKYISAVFKKETGKSVREYLSEQIVERAKESLLNSEYSIAQIAYSFGFSDVQNFTRTFKKISGLTPMDFRNQFLVVYEDRN